MKYKELQEKARKACPPKVIDGYKVNTVPNRKQRRATNYDIPFDNVQTVIKEAKS